MLLMSTGLVIVVEFRKKVPKTEPGRHVHDHLSYHTILSEIRYRPSLESPKLTSFDTKLSAGRSYRPCFRN